FGAERSRRKEGSILTFDPEKLVRVGRLYNLETRIQTKMTVGVGDAGNVGCRKELQASSNLSGRKDIVDVGDVGSIEETSEFPSQSIREDVRDVGCEGSRGGTPGIIEDHNNGKNEEITTILPNRAQKLDEIDTNTTHSSNLNDCFWSDNTPQSPVEPTLPTSPTPDNNIILGAAVAATTAGRIYRIYPHSDIFACENCKRKGDKWDMQKHPCRGSKK